VLDPFVGSGSTGIAALAEGLGFLGSESMADYAPIIAGRLEAAVAGRFSA
jgi:site-specific DNA-methyltransferase (adenine-specific)